MGEFTQDQIEAYSHAMRSSADDLRRMGFAVAVHNDYRRNNLPYTFWLMTIVQREDVLAFKGEGPSDAAALDEIRAQWAKRTDKLHHAPMCPANHNHGKRAPSGPCTCGAADLASKS